MEKHDADRDRSSLSRHRFLRVAGATALAASSASLFDIQAALAAPVVRKDIGGLSASDSIIKSYVKAIAKMRALDTTHPNSPLSWNYQAAIHGTVLSGHPGIWNTCEHGTEWFWSWHRMYLHWFENIIRKMSGDPGWALPFWAWDSASERQLPAMFRDKSSALYWPHRDSAMNDGSGSLPAWRVDYSAAFATPIYTTAPLSTGANDMFQNTPHGAVHMGVGDWFGNIQKAAQDPIFYLHHANCDRLWQVWRGSYGGNDPVTDSTWTGKSATFYNQNGHTVAMNACEVLNAAQQLNYVYQGGPTLTPEHCLPTLSPHACCIPLLEVLYQLPNPPVELTQQTVSIPIQLPTTVREKLASFGRTPDQHIYLQLGGIHTPTQPGVIWETYIGLPPNVAPDPSGPYYVGNVAMFGVGIRDQMPEMFRPAQIALRINAALRASAQTSGGMLRVTFVPSGILINGKRSVPQVKSTVTISQMKLIGETIKRQ